MVADIVPDIIGITESWAHKDMVDADLMLPGYVMLRKDRQERMGGGVIMYIKDSIQAYELQMEKEAECEEAIWCNIATKHSTLTIATECWIILKDEIEGIIETFVPLQNQGKRSRKKHLSKEAIRKIAYKQIMWRIYRNTGNIEDYNNYKKALNLATAEMRKSKRYFEQKLANDIKNDSKSF